MVISIIDTPTQREQLAQIVLVAQLIALTNCALVAKDQVLMSPQLYPRYEWLQDAECENFNMMHVWIVKMQINFLKHIFSGLIFYTILSIKCRHNLYIHLYFLNFVFVWVSVHIFLVKISIKSFFALKNVNTTFSKKKETTWHTFQLRNLPICLPFFFSETWFFTDFMD